VAHGVLTALGAWMVYASTMAALADEWEVSDPGPERDERVFLHEVPWEDYARLERIRGESARPRLTYLDGELELMSPSNSHEGVKTCLARLLEAYADERELPLNGYGSWTLKSRRKKSAAEPDECYCLGPVGRVPDIAIGE
jgi:Uma2 family endonuclease